MGGKTESPHPELTALLYNSGFPLGCLSCWQPLQQMVVSARPAWSTSPLSGHVLCGAQGTNPSRLSGTAFTWPCCAHLGEGTSNSFTPFMHLAWKLLVLGHDAPRLGTLPLQDSPTCSTDHLETGKKGPEQYARIHRTMYQAGTPQWWPAGNMWDSSWGWILPIIKI